MDKTGHITARLILPEAASSSSAVPVEVSDHKSVVRARGLAGTALSLAPGRYLVTATTPDGQAWTAGEFVEIGEGESRIVNLVSDSDNDWIARLEPVSRESPAPAPANERQMRRASQTIRAAEPKTPFPPLAGDDANPATWVASVIRGRWLENWMLAADVAVPDRSVGGFTREPVSAGSFEVSPVWDADTLVEIVTLGKATYFTVPFDDIEQKPTRVRIVPDEVYGANVQFEFENRTIQDFLAYVTRGQSENARTVARSLAPEPASKANQDTKSPLASVIGAYVLLRANETEALDLWTKRLLDEFGGRMPDALPLRVEILARLGRHQEVIAIGLGALDIPRLPWFRSGVGYLSQRLEQYINFVQANPKSRLLTKEQLDVFVKLLAGLNRLTWSIDETRTVCVFRGLEQVYAPPIS